jgi:hypothetical protein
MWIAVSVAVIIGAQKLGIGLMAIACLVPYLVIFFHYHPFSLVLLWLVLLLPKAVFPEIALRAQGFVFTPLDPAYFFSIVCIITLAATRKTIFIKTLKEDPFPCIFICIVLVYVILNTSTYGKSAIGEARKFYFYFLFPLLTALSIQASRDLQRLLLMLFFVASGITLIGLYSILRGQWEGHGLSAESVQILSCVLFSILISYVNGMVITNRIFDSIMVVLFLSIVVKAMHRSVFMETALGLCIFIMLYKNHMLMLLKAGVITIIMFAMLGIGILSVPKLEKGFAVFIRPINGIIDPHSDATASWRIKRWSIHLEKVTKANKLLFGEGLGGYYVGEKKGDLSEPHNAYEQMVIKFGFFGLLIYGLLVYKFFRHTFAVRKRLSPGPLRAYVDMGIVNVGAAHAYMIGYGINLIVLIFYALGMGAAILSISILERPIASSRRGFAMAGRGRATAYNTA